jgi:hypothetical protein
MLFVAALVERARDNTALNWIRIFVLFSDVCVTWKRDTMVIPAYRPFYLVFMLTKMAIFHKPHIYSAVTHLVSL